MNTRKSALVLASALAIAVVGMGDAQAAPTPAHHNIPGVTTHGFTGVSVTPQASSAKTGKTKEGSTTAAVKPDAIVVGCDYDSGAPGFLTTGSATVNAASKITSCTTDPAPLECHLTAQIEQLSPGGFGVWLAAGEMVDSKWGPCTKKAYKPKYACVGLVEKKQYRTETTLAITYNDDGTIGSASTYKYSGTATLYCD